MPLRGATKWLGAGNDDQVFAAEKLANLAAGVFGPGSMVVELDVGAPVAQRGALLAAALIGERQVVVGIGVGWRESDGFEIGGDGFVETFELIEHVAQIEIGQHVAGIGHGGVAIQFLSPAVLAEMEVDGAEVDRGRRVVGIEGENFLIEGNGAWLFAGFLGTDCSQKAFLKGTRTCGRGAAQGLGFRGSGGDCLLAAALEVEEELAADGIDHGAVMAEGQARTGAHNARLEERVGHAGDGLHGQDRFADGGRGHVFSTQRTQDAQLPQILEAINLLLRDQSGSFPGLQLTGTHLEDAQNVLTQIGGQSCAPTGGARQFRVCILHSNVQHNMRLCAPHPATTFLESHAGSAHAAIMPSLSRICAWINGVEP